MKKVIHFLFSLPLFCFSQGLINNGAYIVLTNTSNIYIDGATGNYTNQSGGLISNSSAGGTITLLGNWTNNAANVAFNNDGSTVIFSGANQSIGGTNSSTFFNVNLLGSGTKTLNVNTTVGGISTLTGVLSVGARILDLNSRTLTITNPAAGGITYGAGYIQSETNAAVNPSIIQWNMGTSTGAHVYPFGVVSTGNQIPFTFNKTTAGSANISVSTRSTAANTNLPWPGASNVAAVTSMMAMGPPFYTDASIPSAIDRWWDITASAAVTANLIFSYRGVENTTTAAPLGTFGAQHWNGASWDAPVGTGGGVTAGVGTVSVTGASTFSPWVLSSSILPLPIELIYFKGACSNNKILLEWATASETSNDYFTIEKSNDGVIYYEIATINGAGNSTQTISYSYTDNSVNNNLVYYRLKQTDYNGHSKTFNTISLSPCGDLNEISVGAYSNNNGGVVVFVDEKSAKQYQIVLFDALGKKLKQESIYSQVGKSSYILDVNDLSVGVYFISIENVDNRFVQKLYIR